MKGYIRPPYSQDFRIGFPPPTHHICDDMHVSLQHFAIVRDHVAGWHLECLTPDGCGVVHERTVKMGRPRKLKHGDAIVVMVHKKSGRGNRQ